MVMTFSIAAFAQNRRRLGQAQRKLCPGNVAARHRQLPPALAKNAVRKALKPVDAKKLPGKKRFPQHDRHDTVRYQGVLVLSGQQE
jgi:hypothetical protein